MREGSRHVRYSQRKLRGDKRTLPQYGERDDSGKYYRCWNCGFMCDSERDSLGGPDEGSGLSHTDFSSASHGSQDTSDSLNSVIVLGGINHSHVAMELDSDGNTKSVKHDFQSVSGVGCPFCSSLNWR